MFKSGGISKVFNNDRDDDCFNFYNEVGLVSTLLHHFRVMVPLKSFESNIMWLMALNQLFNDCTSLWLVTRRTEPQLPQSLKVVGPSINKVKEFSIGMKDRSYPKCLGYIFIKTAQSNLPIFSYYFWVLKPLTNPNA